MSRWISLPALLCFALVVSVPASADGAPGKPKPKDPAPQPEPKAEPKPAESKVDRVGAGLNWLRDHQNFEGYWSSARFQEDSIRKDAKRSYNLEFVKPGKADGDIGWSDDVDVGLTGLGLLSFVGAGYDHKEGDYRETVRRALMYLRKVQANDGCFGAKEEDCFVYNHAIATMALCEAYGISGDEALKKTGDRAVDFILKAQNPGLAWRYGVKPGENDTSFTGWAILALKSARIAGLEFETKDAFDGAVAWLDSVTVVLKGVAKTGYNLPASDNARLRAAQSYETNPTMDAINVCTRLLMGTSDAKDKNLVSQVKVIGKSLPSWAQKKLDYMYWFWGTMAMFQIGGDSWTKWESAICKTLQDNQRGFKSQDKETTEATLDEYGSWDAVDAWGAAGGRVYATTVNCLTLEIANRAKRLQPKEK